MIHDDTHRYNRRLQGENAAIGETLARLIDQQLGEAQNKIWHAHPVWFIDGNPIVGYGKLKHCVRLLFWSGQSFQTPLKASGSFKAAEIRYTSVDDVDETLLATCLSESRDVQWDYKNIVKRKGRLDRLS